MSIKTYIRAAAAISPQKTFGDVPFLADPVLLIDNRLRAVEPDYTKLIDAKILRRMSRIIKMGVATASACLQEAGENNPDAIITGTAYGCLEDTGVFLTQVIERNEEMPPPTAFIQSTHNTVGSQIALGLKCHQYNNTFVHRAFSFESALLDAMLLLKEQEAKNVVVGSIDELTDNSFAILSRFGLYKPTPVSDLFGQQSKGTIAGEGCAFFFLSNESSGESYAQLEGVSTFYKPKDIPAIEQHILSFLRANAVNITDIDLIITGNNGDITSDDIYKELRCSVFRNNALGTYKQFCGEYPTAISFALWLAATILKTAIVPAAIGYTGPKNNTPQRILIYNHYQQTHHSLMLVSAVQ